MGKESDTGKLDKNVEPTRAEFVKQERDFNKKSGEVKASEANNARTFNLLLLHCSLEFKYKL